MLAFSWFDKCFLFQRESILKRFYVVVVRVYWLCFRTNLHDQYFSCPYFFHSAADGGGSVAFGGLILLTGLCWDGNRVGFVIEVQLCEIVLVVI